MSAGAEAFLEVGWPNECWCRNNAGAASRSDGRGFFSTRERKKQKRASKLGRASNRPGRRLGRRWSAAGAGEWPNWPLGLLVTGPLGVPTGSDGRPGLPMVLLAWAC